MSTTHGHTKWSIPSATYIAWSNMRGRCRNPTHPNYRYYGARGIKVCDRWQNFEYFLADMGEVPSGFSIERVDNDGDYTPTNCRWIPRVDQAKNTRRIRTITYQGKTLRLTEWAKLVGIHHETLKARLNIGLPIEKALTAPVTQKNRWFRARNTWKRSEMKRRRPEQDKAEQR